VLGDLCSREIDRAGNDGSADVVGIDALTLEHRLALLGMFADRTPHQQDAFACISALGDELILDVCA